MQQPYRKVSNGYDSTAPRRQAEPNRRPAPSGQPRRRKKQYKKVQVRYIVHPENVARRQNALKNCLTIAVVFLLLSAVIAGNAKISSLNLENIEIQQNIDNLETNVEKTKLQIATKCGLDDIATVASEDLDMGFPKNGQVRYVEMKQPQPVTLEPIQEKGWLAKLWDSFIALFK